jgi:hypothetical protein
MQNSFERSSRSARFFSFGVILGISTVILGSCCEKPKQFVPPKAGYVIPENSIYVRVCKKEVTVDFGDLSDLVDVAVCEGGAIQWNHTKMSGHEVEFSIDFPNGNPFPTSPILPVRSSNGTAERMGAALPPYVKDVHSYDCTVSLNTGSSKPQNVHIIVLGTNPMEDLIKQQ